MKFLSLEARAPFKIALAATLVLLAIAGCESSQQQRPEDSADYKLLQEQGFTNIKLYGIAPFKCSDSDNIVFSDAFTATGPTGLQLSGTICGGFLKGKTIRYN